MAFELTLKGKKNSLKKEKNISEIQKKKKKEIYRVG